jgi:hypothetical protein
VEINRDKKNGAFTFVAVSQVLTYQRWKLTGGAGEYSGKRQMFYAELWKNLNQRDRRTQFSFM